MVGDVFSSVAAAALLVLVAGYHTKLRHALRPRPLPPPLARYPSVTVVCPIKGLDAGAMENILSDLGTAYPGFVETLFVFDDETEPAVELVRRALTDKPPPGNERSARLIFAGAPRAGRTGKLNAMIAGYDASAGELVAFLDSDLRPGPDDLRLLVETLLATPGAGAAFAPVVVRDPPLTLGDTGYALMLNGLYSPVAAAATLARHGSLPFIMGQFMVFRRDALTEIGGLASAEGQLVDDMFLGMRLDAFGHRNMVAPRAVTVVQRGLPLRDFWGVYQRWITFSRSGLPIRTFQIRTWVLPALYWMGLLSSVGAGLFGHFVAAALFALVPVAVTASLVRLHRALGGGPLRPAHRLGAGLLLLVAPAVLLGIALHHEVSWRGRRYTLDTHARLAARGAHAKHRARRPRRKPARVRAADARPAGCRRS